jgi:hypothetical protein
LFTFSLNLRYNHIKCDEIGQFSFSAAQYGTLAVALNGVIVKPTDEVDDGDNFRLLNGKSEYAKRVEDG